MGDWISSLQTDTLQRGFELALLLARKGIAYTQPSAEVRRELREVYAKNANSLIIASHFVAAYFQTVSMNNSGLLYEKGYELECFT